MATRNPKTAHAQTDRGVGRDTHRQNGAAPEVVGSRTKNTGWQPRQLKIAATQEKGEAHLQAERQRNEKIRRLMLVIAVGCSRCLAQTRNGKNERQARNWLRRVRDWIPTRLCRGARGGNVSNA